MPAEQVLRMMNEKHLGKGPDLTTARAKPRIPAGSNLSAAIVVSDDDGESGQGAAVAADRSAAPAEAVGATGRVGMDIDKPAGGTDGGTTAAVGEAPDQSSAQGVKRDLAGEHKNEAGTSTPAPGLATSGEEPAKRFKPELG